MPTTPTMSFFEWLADMNDTSAAAHNMTCRPKSTHLGCFRPSPKYLLLAFCFIASISKTSSVATTPDGPSLSSPQRPRRGWNLPHMIGGDSSNIIETVGNTTTPPSPLNLAESTCESQSQTTDININEAGTNTFFVVKRDGTREPLNATRVSDEFSYRDQNNC